MKTERELVVRSERVMLPAGERAAAVQVRDGRVLAVTPHGERPAGVRDIDVGALVVRPGFVDTHVHMNDPGRAGWEGADHATRAAAAAGVTTVVDMPLNSIPATTTVAGLEAKRGALEGRCHVDVAFWGGLVPGNIRDLAPLAAAGVRGFKCFLSPSGVDEFGHVGEADLREALPHLARLPLPLLVHAELPAHLREPDGDPRAYATWLNSRPPEAEHAAIELLIDLASQYDVQVHVVHLACAEPLRALAAARHAGARISIETCPHYLVFAAEGIADGATAFKCAPPIRGAAHRDALWRALLGGEIQMVATDHSPAPAALKGVETGDFVQAWGGVASLQHGFAAAWTGAAARGIPLAAFLEWTASAPARLAGLEGTKGAIAPGVDADLVIWDPDGTTDVMRSDLLYRHPVTPYEGLKLSGRVQTTMLRGSVIFHDGQVAATPAGRVTGACA